MYTSRNFRLSKNTSRKTRDAKNRRKIETLVEKLQKMGIEPDEIIYELPEDQLSCPICGEQMKQSGSHHVRYEIGLKSLKDLITVRDIREAVYTCPECKKKSAKAGENTDPKGFNIAPVSAEAPRPLLNGCRASISIITLLIFLKFQYQLPLNRIRNIMLGFGCIVAQTATLCRWMIQAAKQYFLPLYNRLKSYLLQRTLGLAADETTLRVINEAASRKKSKSFLWQYRTLAADALQIVLFQYTEGRGGKYCAEFLSGYNGPLVVDGYAGYNKTNCPLVNCWAHARRGFIISSMFAAVPEARTQAEIALDLIDELFYIEAEMDEQGFSYDQKPKIRQEQSRPVVEKLYAWAEAIDTSELASEKFRKAIGISSVIKKG